MKLTKGSVRIGWASRDITPQTPCELDGQYYERIARTVRDRLYVTAWAIESGGSGRHEQVVMAALDLVAVPADLLADIRRRVRSRVKDLDVSRIMANAIHTHSSLSTAERPPWLRTPQGVLRKDEFREMVVVRTAEAIEEAWRSRQAGYISSTLGHAAVGHCRRAWYADGTAEMYGRTDRADFVGMEAGEDPGVDMMFCWDARKKLTGVVVNLACPSQVMEATYTVTADFMGEARRQLRERFGRKLFFLPQIAPAGDQSPRDLVRNYQGAEPDFWHECGAVELGRRIAVAVAEGYEPARESMQSRVEFKHTVKTVPLPVWRATKEEYRRASEAFRKLNVHEPKDPDSPKAAFNRFCAEVHAGEAQGGHGPYDSKLHEFVRLRVNEAVMNRYRDQDAMSPVPLELHAVRLGDAVFATNPFELFLDYGSRIKAASPARQNFLIQLSCGYEGYLPTARAIDRGGYGATMCSATIGAAGGDVLVEASVKAINALWK